MSPIEVVDAMLVPPDCVKVPVPELAHVLAGCGELAAAARLYVPLLRA